MGHIGHLPAGLGGAGLPGNGGLLGCVAHEDEVGRRGAGRRRSERTRGGPGTRFGRTVGFQVNRIGGGRCEAGHRVESVREAGECGAATKRVESAGLAIQHVPAVSRLLEVYPVEVGGIGADVGHRGSQARTTRQNIGYAKVRTVGGNSRRSGEGPPTGRSAPGPIRMGSIFRINGTIRYSAASPPMPAFRLSRIVVPAIRIAYDRSSVGDRH